MAAPSLVSNRSDWVEYCQNINKARGQREKKYQEILQLYKTAVESPQDIESLKSLHENFIIIIEQIPQEIQERESIKSCLTPLSEQISSIYKKRIGKELKNLYQQLELSYDSNQMEQLYGKVIYIRDISNKWTSEFG